MAGYPLGAHAPDSQRFTSPGVPAAETGALAARRVHADSRTRRNHGVFLLGTELASVYSSRRECSGLGVTLTVGNGAVVLTGAMSSTQARAMAKALAAAAEAFDATAGRARTTAQAEV